MAYLQNQAANNNMQNFGNPIGCHQQQQNPCGPQRSVKKKCKQQRCNSGILMGLFGCLVFSMIALAFIFALLSWLEVRDTHCPACNCGKAPHSGPYGGQGKTTYGGGKSTYGGGGSGKSTYGGGGGGGGGDHAQVLQEQGETVADDASPVIQSRAKVVQSRAKFGKARVAE